MKTIHIIPSVFSYFGDVRRRAFRLIECLQAAGITADAITLEYGKPEDKEVEDDNGDMAMQKNIPKRNYLGQVSIANAFDQLAAYDVVHLHLPFFGAARALLAWRRQNPNVPMVVTYYHDVAWSDPLSWLFQWYNRHYIPPLFAAASAVLCANFEVFLLSRGWRLLLDKNKLIACDGPITSAISDLTFPAEAIELMGADYAEIAGTIRVYFALTGIVS